MTSDVPIHPTPLRFAHYAHIPTPGRALCTHLGGTRGVRAQNTETFMGTILVEVKSPIGRVG
jgi:hypothetical protein